MYHRLILLLGGLLLVLCLWLQTSLLLPEPKPVKYIYGFLIGVSGYLYPCTKPGYPRGMMLAILLLNAFAPLIDFYVVDSNVKRRLKRAIKVAAYKKQHYE